MCLLTLISIYVPIVNRNRLCIAPETGGIHQAYRGKRVLKSCSVVYAGKTTDFFVASF